MAITIAVVVCALGVAVGTIGFVWALRGGPGASRRKADSAIRGSAIEERQFKGRRGHEAPWIGKWSSKVGLSLAVALIVGTITRWPVAALLGAVGTFAVPAVLKSTSSRETARRTEAVAIWTELLRDTLATSAGLAQAIVATGTVAPNEIQEQVAHLGDRIMSGVPMDEALRSFASEVDEPSAEQVVFALRLAAASRAQRLVELLGALADSTREEVAMRLRVEASRASARSGVRTTIWFSVGFVVLLMTLARSYLAPFGSVTGQLVLAFVGACYAAGVAMMVHLVRPASSRERSAQEALR